MTIEIAEQFEQQEDYEKAYDEYKRLLAKKPNNIDLLQRTANVALILEKKDEASELLLKILSLDPENIMCYEQLMDIYNDTDKYKYYITYNGSDNTYTIADNSIYNYSNIYFKNWEDAQAVIDNPNFRDILNAVYKN